MREVMLRLSEKQIPGCSLVKASEVTEDSTRKDVRWRTVPPGNKRSERYLLHFLYFS